MENIASGWLLFGIGLIALNIIAQRLSLDRYRAPGRVLKTLLAMVTFLFFFYSTTFAMSLLYALDSAFLKFWRKRGGYKADSTWSDAADPTRGAKLLNVPIPRVLYMIHRKKLPALKGGARAYF